MLGNDGRGIGKKAKTHPTSKINDMADFHGMIIRALIFIRLADA